jgi:MFS family permease
MDDSQVFVPRMPENRSDRLNTGRTVLLSLSFFTVLLSWSYFNLKVPLLLNEILPEFPGRDTVKGLVMALDNILALLLQPVFGDLSDRAASRFGRRIPFITAGTIGAALFYVLIPWMQLFWAFVLVVFVFNLFMSLYRTVALVILPDYTPDSVRPKGSAIQQFIANMGGVIGFGVPILLSYFTLSEQWADSLGFAIIALLMLTALAVQLSSIRETPTGRGVIAFSSRAYEIDPVTLRGRQQVAPAGGPEESMLSRIRKVLWEDGDMRRFVLAVFFWYLGFAAVEAFFSSLAVTYLGAPSDAHASRLFLAYTVPMIASAYFVGLVGQRYGRKRAVIGFLLWLLTALAIFSFIVVPASFQQLNEIVIMLCLALISIPWMGVIVNSFPMLWSLAPESRVATYTGLYYTFNQAAYSLSPVLMGGLLSLSAGLDAYRYIVMFPFVFLCYGVGLLFLLRVRMPYEDKGGAGSSGAGDAS